MQLYSNTGEPRPLQGLEGWEVETGGERIPGNIPVMPGMREGGIPNGLGSKGREEIRILSISDSCSRFVLARRF